MLLGEAFAILFWSQVAKSIGRTFFIEETNTGDIEIVKIVRSKPLMTHDECKQYMKEAETQAGRTREKAEVFTPSWVCNKQNNLIDEAWFGKSPVFNKEENKSWMPVKKRITFPRQKGRYWQDYVTEVESLPGKTVYRHNSLESPAFECYNI